MPRVLPYVFSVLILALLVGGPLAYSNYRQARLRHFNVVEEGVLYRSGQLTLAGLKQLIHDYGIKTVVTLRDAYRPDQQAPDLDEENYCNAQEIAYHRISPRPWAVTDGTVPAAAGVKQFLDVMRDPANYPVLVHCFAGIHRTGAHCAVYRMESHHWSNERAIAEVVAHGYSNLDGELDLLSFLENYRPAWKRAEGE
ncbi:MAG TPA: tyrosine-protein phosphatase [Gemmataceae bacterium]|nr:tyrosine-protein phosphatase [Gemmataceae bacterium]